jgi:RimJ/RimL family protein N-acetyltransferase
MAHTLPSMSDIALKTPRLEMRPLAPGDAAALAQIASDERVGLNLGLVPCPCSPEQVEQWIADAPAQIAAGTDYLLTLRDTASGEIVGSAGLDEMIEQGVAGREYDLGYWLDPAWWGKGLASECALALRDWAFDTLKAGGLRACCLMTNQGSAKVLEKTGFHFMNTVLRDRPARGHKALVAQFRMDKPRWEQCVRQEKQEGARQTGEQA